MRLQRICMHAAKDLPAVRAPAATCTASTCHRCSGFTAWASGTGHRTREVHFQNRRLTFSRVRLLMGMDSR